MGKHDSQGRAHNMAATSNTVDGGGVVVAVGVGGGGTCGGNGPPSPVPEWSADPVLLKDFAAKWKVPGFARVVKGSYMTLGSSKFSFQKQHTDIFIHSVKMGVKVLGHCLKRVDLPGPRRGQTLTRLYSTDQRLTVPITYQGWFELLSEDGKSARPLANVPELARASPARCLVRENMKGYLSSGEGRLTFDKTKIIPAGEQLRLCGELSLPAPSQNVKVKLLKCLDTKGDTVYLSFDQKGLFTPIAGEKDFTGVFNIRDIVKRFRLPLTVKLAQGVRPRVPDSKFSGIIRLDWVYTEETAFVCPVEKNHVRLLPVPSDASLQLVAASNQEEMCDSDMFRSMQAKCTRMVSNYNNTLHLIITLPESVMKTHQRNARASNVYSMPLKAAATGNAPTGMRRSKSREDILFEEIDDLYGYVREGGAPPKPRFQYDSDEESYWEEPAYEPLDEFRARLKAMESGQKVSFPEFYKPADPSQLKGLVGSSPGTSARVETRVDGEAGSGALNPGDKSDSVYGVASNGPGKQPPAAEEVDEEPPPLPPRPAEMASANVAAINVTTVNVSTNSITSTSTTGSSTHLSDLQEQVKFSHSRRVSAPLPPPAHAFADTSSTGASSKTSTASRDSVDAAAAPSSPPQRVSRSDSEPSIPLTFPPSAAAARQKGTSKQQTQGEATKPDWKERLRRFNAMQNKGDGEKEGSSSASSDSASRQKLTAQKMARDFKDSDMSSRTKASSSSSGGQAARKRMQTLYL